MPVDAPGILLACALAAGVSLFAADKPVSFRADIQPVFESSCWKCHGSAVQLSKLDLRTRESALKGGERGAAIVPGKAEDSRLYRLVAGLEKPSMPMDGKLTAEQISAIQGLDQSGCDVGRHVRWQADASHVDRGDADIPGGAELLGVSEARASFRACGFRG